MWVFYLAMPMSLTLIWSATVLPKTALFVLTVVISFDLRAVRLITDIVQFCTQIYRLIINRFVCLIQCSKLIGSP